MFSSNQTEVIVVAPDNYSSLARRMVHEISKYQDTKAAFWTTSQYKDNEPTQAGDRPVIFIGNADENEFTNSYLECIHDLEEDEGTVYGYDASRAVIFGRGVSDQNINLNNLKGLGKVCIISTSSTSIASAGALVLGGPLVAAGGYAAYQYYTNVKKDRNRRAEQVDKGIDLFLDEALEEWLEIKTNENK